MSLNDYVQAGREWEAEQERKRREAEFVEQHKRAAPKPTPDHISLRDWFAGQAMNGFLSNPENSTAEFEELAAVAYEVADAMLKERNKP